MKIFTRNLLQITLILLLFGAWNWWLNVSSGETGAPRPAYSLSVESALPERRDLRPEYHFRGELRPSQSVELRFEVSGRVRRVSLEAGQEVEQGQVLLEIEDLDYRDTAMAARARLHREREQLARDRELLALARAEVELLKKERERLEQLSERSLAAHSQVEEMRLRLLGRQAELARLRHQVSAAATLQTLQAELRMAERNLERTRLRAPFSGTVNRVAVEEGESIRPEHLAVELLRLEPLELRVWVPGKVITALHIGLRLNILVDDVGTTPAEVRSLQAAAEPNTHTHELRLRVPAAPGLRPGLLATVPLPGETLSNALVLPEAALLREAGRTYVFQIIEQRLRQAPVRVLQEHAGWVALAALDPDIPVAISDVASLSDGQPVRRREPEHPSPDPEPTD